MTGSRQNAVKGNSGSAKPKRASTEAAAKNSGRCGWAGSDPLYIDYHDKEWGLPQADDRILFEKLVLEGFQAGLSWITILRKRDNFRRAFHQFDASKIAGYGKRDITRLMNDETIVRNRLKIEAAIANAKAYLALTSRQSFASFIWDFLPDGPIINARQSMADVPAATELSTTISKALKARGFRFVGPTTVYAFMQSMGLVNDHLTSCRRYRPCASLQRNFRPPEKLP